jgi:hypothetical protein
MCPDAIGEKVDGRSDRARQYIANSEQASRAACCRMQGSPGEPSAAENEVSA